MTAHDAFLSWANWVKTKLAADNVAVNVEMYSAKNLTMPYLFLEEGPEFPLEGEWMTGLFAQARLVVSKVDGQQIEVTAGRLLTAIVKSIRSVGPILKYDYSTDTPVDTKRKVTFKRIQGSPEMSGDPNQSQKVLRYELYSNNA